MTAEPMPAGRIIDAALELLDRQLIDSDGVAAGKVDDLELTELADGSLVVTAILSGPGALAPRLGGRLGTAWAATFARLHPDADPAPARISFGVVRDLDGAQVRLSLSRHHLDGNRLEHWVRDRFISRIPGAGHEPE
ncbi:hypothetical protein [Aquihabitans sp. McL0605]|uniref:hypothetical protein n=1 Tax=Aquihabitans sp. McL0605 TaxID=3415671 RepID=UPI003CF16B81